MKITFKRQPKETGLSAIAYPWPNVDLKIRGKVFGYIGAPNWNCASNSATKWTIHIAVIKFSFGGKDEKYDDNNPNCSWMWVNIKPQFDSEEDARTWITKNSQLIQDQFGLYFFK